MSLEKRRFSVRAHSVIDGDTGLIVAHCSPDEKVEHLFAASPKLVDALKKCLLVLSATDMTKQGLIDALESGNEAIQEAMKK